MLDLAARGAPYLALARTIAATAAPVGQLLTAEAVLSHPDRTRPTPLWRGRSAGSPQHSVAVVVAACAHAGRQLGLTRASAGK